MRREKRPKLQFLRDYINIRDVLNTKRLLFADMSANADKPLSATKFPFFKKGMQNVLKRKILEGFYVEFFLLESNILNHSESTDMHIEKF